MGVASLTLGMCITGFGLASMVAESKTDHSSSGRIIMGGMSAAVFGAICMLVGNKIYPLAWNCGRGNDPWPSYPDMSKQQSPNCRLSSEQETEVETSLLQN